MKQVNVDALAEALLVNVNSCESQAVDWRAIADKYPADDPANDRTRRFCKAQADAAGDMARAYQHALDLLAGFTVG